MARWICWPRCRSSIETRPRRTVTGVPAGVDSCFVSVSAIPVPLEPGSMRSCTPSTADSASVRSLRRMVKGVCRATAARPLVSSSRAGGMAGHERLSALCQDEDSACACSAAVGVVRWGDVTVPVLCLCGVTPTGLGAVSVGLPSPMFPAGAPRRGGVSVSRFVPAPRGVCSRGFQCGLLRKHSSVGLLACGKRSHQGHLPLIDDRDDWGCSLGSPCERERERVISFRVLVKDASCACVGCGSADRYHRTYA